MPCAGRMRRRTFGAATVGAARIGEPVETCDHRLFHAARIGRQQPVHLTMRAQIGHGDEELSLTGSRQPADPVRREHAPGGGSSAGCRGGVWRPSLESNQDVERVQPSVRSVPPPGRCCRSSRGEVPQSKSASRVNRCLPATSAFNACPGGAPARHGRHRRMPGRFGGSRRRERAPPIQDLARSAALPRRYFRAAP
jgi:hypothetical protein